MIDIERAKKEFDRYVSNYDKTEKKIEGKISHSYRVMEISAKIAKSLNLEEEQVKLATLIGLLHDIARFEQFKRYRTYKDVDSIDHGDYGVKILQENNNLRKYIETTDYDDIILKAIKNHNKFEIDTNLIDEEKIQAKIIRDADKVDILYQVAYMFWEDAKEEVETSTITKYIEEEFYKRKSIKRRKGIQINQLDKMVTTLGFVFDINYTETFRIIKENNYINIIIDQFDFHDKETKFKIEEIRKIVNDFIEEKLKKGH